MNPSPSLGAQTPVRGRELLGQERGERGRAALDAPASGEGRGSLGQPDLLPGARTRKLAKEKGAPSPMTLSPQQKSGGTQAGGAGRRGREMRASAPVCPAGSPPRHPGRGPRSSVAQESRGRALLG